MAKNKNFPQHGLTSRQFCDKCRNHGVFFKKRYHKMKKQCQFEKCDCPHCRLTDSRRLVMKLQQKVRRAGITAKEISSETEDDEDSNRDSQERDQQNDGGDVIEGDIYDETNIEQDIAEAIKAATLAIEALPRHYKIKSNKIKGENSSVNQSGSQSGPSVNRAHLKVRILKTELTLPREVKQADDQSTLSKFRGTESLQPPVTIHSNVNQYPELVPNSWEKPDSRLSPPDSRMSPPNSRLSPPDSRMSPPNSRLSPPDSRMSPPDSRMSPPVSVASYLIAKYSPQTPKPSQSTPTPFETKASINQEIRDEGGWPNAPVTEPSLIHPHFPPALPPHTGAPMLLPPSHPTYLNRMPPFYPLVSQADKACAAPQMFLPPRGNLPPLFSNERSLLYEKSPQSDYSSMSKSFDSCKNRSIRDKHEGCHQYENDIGVADRDDFRYGKLFSHGVIGHPGERITAQDSISVPQPAPANALEELDYFAKMQLQRQFPEHFARIAEQTYPVRQPARHPTSPVPLVGSQPGMDAALHNPIQP
ncbi:uncharacterized protein LOC125179112 [Hyalella azteca]|uniref:Uncharacterized protein LOC125179112 n=1 Tax=Hyalella azteca TaxID=294128 RepID=A0A979FUK5_HYAAZ|nr:uncharacterized protein LOC125179112 [Hyalella azteca]